MPGPLSSLVSLPYLHPKLHKAASTIFQNIPKHVTPSRNSPLPGLFPLSLGSRPSSPHQAFRDQTPSLPSSLTSTTPFSKRHTPTRLNCLQFLKRTPRVLISGSLPGPSAWNPLHPLLDSAKLSFRHQGRRYFFWEDLLAQVGVLLRALTPHSSHAGLKWAFGLSVSRLHRELWGILQAGLGPR